MEALHAKLGCAKEYVVCSTELDGFEHLHIHIIPRADNLPEELKGARIFTMIHANKAEAVPLDEIRRLCENLRVRFQEFGR